VLGGWRLSGDFGIGFVFGREADGVFAVEYGAGFVGLYIASNCPGTSPDSLSPTTEIYKFR
jgi:hypothetical protein